MLASCPSRELLANPFRTSPSEVPIKTAYVPVIIAQPEPPRDSTRTCSKSTPPTPNDKPWLTEEVKAAIDKKNKLYQAARESNKPEDWAAFKRQRFAVGKLIRATRPARKPLHQPKSDFYCDPCDCGFADQAEYDDHVAQHVTCDHDGCKFSACPKLVELHVKLQHDTGLVRRIPTDSPEDATEWIKQRKARYPTLHNIAAKKAQEEEMKGRKEVLKTKTSRRRCRRPQRRRRGRGRKDDNKTAQKAVPANAGGRKEEVFEEADGGLAKFRGTGETDKIQREDTEDEDKEEGQITDSDSERPTASAAVVKKEMEVAGALKSLIACYGSSSEEEPEGKPSAPLQTKPDDPPVPSEALKQSRLPQRQAKRKAPVQGKVPHISKRRLTLLEKLLANEMRHERNVLLQCVHFVVKNRFFEGPRDEKGAACDAGGKSGVEKTDDISAMAAGCGHVINEVESNVSYQGEERKDVLSEKCVGSTVEDRCMTSCANGVDAVETDGARK